MVADEDVIRGEMAVQTSVRASKIIRSRYLEMPRKNLRIVEDGNKGSEEGIRGCGQKLSRSNLLSICPSYLEKFTESRSVQGVGNYSVFSLICCITDVLEYPSW